MKIRISRHRATTTTEREYNENSVVYDGSVKMRHQRVPSACRMCRMCAPEHNRINIHTRMAFALDVKELTEQKIILLIYYHNNFHREIFSMCIYKYLNIYFVSCYCVHVQCLARIHGPDAIATCSPRRRRCKLCAGE